MPDEEITIRDIVVEDEREVQRFLAAAHADMHRFLGDDRPPLFRGSNTMMPGDRRRYAAGQAYLRNHGAALIARDSTGRVVGVLMLDKCPYQDRPHAMVICLLMINDEQGQRARELLVTRMRQLAHEHGFVDIYVTPGHYDPVDEWTRAIGA